MYVCVCLRVCAVAVLGFLGSKCALILNTGIRQPQHIKFWMSHLLNFLSVGLGQESCFRIITRNSTQNRRIYCTPGAGIPNTCLCNMHWTELSKKIKMPWRSSNGQELKRAKISKTETAVTRYSDVFSTFWRVLPHLLTKLSHTTHQK